MNILDKAYFIDIMEKHTAFCMLVFYSIDSIGSLPSAPMRWSDIQGATDAHTGVGLICPTTRVDNTLAGFTANMKETHGIPFDTGVTVYGTGLCDTSEDPLLVAVEYIKQPQVMQAGADALFMLHIGDYDR